VLQNVRERSAQLQASLAARVQSHPKVKAIRVQGLMGAVELRTDADERLPRRTAAAMVKRGVLSRSMGSVITLVPPLTITAEEIERIVNALAGALREVAG
jgi:adenosylmethionine-8-amino-7-oxononanoate aminotransferase